MYREWEERDIGPGAVLLEVEGKLRGSRARQLGELLQEIVDRRKDVSRVILDLRSVTSIDSLGTIAIDEALERGLKLDLVLRRGLELDDGRQATELARRGLKVHLTIDAALERTLTAVAR
jgi:hypothetical protein